jgi:hypothetical protein
MPRKRKRKLKLPKKSSPELIRLTEELYRLNEQIKNKELELLHNQQVYETNRNRIPHRLVQEGFQNALIGEIVGSCSVACPACGAQRARNAVALYEGWQLMELELARGRIRQSMPAEKAAVGGEVMRQRAQQRKDRVIEIAKQIDKPEIRLRDLRGRVFANAKKIYPKIARSTVNKALESYIKK